MDQNYFISKRFISARFNVPVQSLGSYALALYKDFSQQKEEYSPALRIISPTPFNQDLFVDIGKGIINKPGFDRENKKSCVLVDSSCSLTETDICFNCSMFPNGKIVFRYEDIADFYDNLWYDNIIQPDLQIPYQKVFLSRKFYARHFGASLRDLELCILKFMEKGKIQISVGFRIKMSNKIINAGSGTLLDIRDDVECFSSAEKDLVACPEDGKTFEFGCYCPLIDTWIYVDYLKLEKLYSRRWYQNNLEYYSFYI